VAISYTGVWSSALDKLINLVAASSTFQTWTGAADAAAAEAYIHESDYSEEESVVKNNRRPCAFVDIELGGAVENTRIFNGTAVIIFEGAVDPAHSEQESFRDFTNRVGAILSEMLQAAEEDTTGNLLNTVRMEGDPIEGPFRAGKQAREGDGDHLICTVRLPYGPDGVAA